MRWLDAVMVITHERDSAVLAPRSSRKSEPAGLANRAVYQAQQTAQKSRKHMPSAAFPLARRTRSQQLAQSEAQVERSHVEQLPLQNVLPLR